MSDKITAAFFGWSNTGKTTFIEKVLEELVRRAVPCAALKCTRHPGGYQLPGKDSTRFFRTGADAALMGGPETVLSLHSPERMDPAFLDRLFPDARVVLIEGGQVEGALRVLAAGGAREESDLKLPLDGMDAVLTADPALAARARQCGIRSIAPEDIKAFIDMLEEHHGT